MGLVGSGTASDTVRGPGRGRRGSRTPAEPGPEANHKVTQAPVGTTVPAGRSCLTTTPPNRSVSMTWEPSACAATRWRPSRTCPASVHVSPSTSGTTTRPVWPATGDTRYAATTVGRASRRTCTGPGIGGWPGLSWRGGCWCIARLVAAVCHHMVTRVDSGLTTRRTVVSKRPITPLSCHVDGLHQRSRTHAFAAVRAGEHSAPVSDAHDDSG